MKKFSDIPVKTKIIASFCVMILLLALVAVTAYLSVASIQEKNNEIYQNDIANIRDVLELRGTISEAREDVLSMISDPNQSQIETWYNDLQDRKSDKANLLERLSASNRDDPVYQQKIKDLTTSLNTFSATRDNEVIPLIRSGKRSDATNLVLGIQKERYAAIKTEVQDLITYIEQGAASSVSQSGQLAALMNLIILIAVAAALILGLGMAYLLTRSISIPLVTLSEKANRIAAGDLSVEVIAEPRGDEIGTLSASFASMTKNLIDNTSYARSLLEANLDPLVTISPEGKITDVNEATVKATGVSRDRLIGSDFSDYFTEPEKAKAGYRKVLLEGYVRDYPLTLRSGTGTLIDVLYNASVYRNTQGEVQGVFAAARDITERKRMEGYARSLIEANLDPLVTISPEGKITDVNDATMKATGVSRDRLIGSDFSDYFTEPEKAKAGYRKVLLEGYVRDYPLTLRTGTGTMMDVLYNASVYRNAQGEVQGVFAAARDITERKRMEDELNQYRDRLELRTSALTKVLEELQETINILTASSSQILTTTTEIASGAAETASAITETTSTVEEVKQTADHASQKVRSVAEDSRRVSATAQAGQKAVGEVIDGMHRVQEQMESIADNVVQLAEKSQAIGEIIVTVNDIAEQSNILAVNASIEAAKAGEQGKGFGVVAQEIRTLADQSKEATAQVRNILTDIQRGVSAAVMATEQGSRTVGENMKQSTEAAQSIKVLTGTIDESAKAATQIAASSQQQLVGLSQIVQSMENIRQASQQNLAGTRQAEEIAKTLHDLGQKLKTIAESYRV